MGNIFHDMRINHLKRKADKMTPEEAYQKGLKLPGDKYEDAIIFYKSAARRGHAEAQYDLAWQLSDSDFVWEEDEVEAEALYWYEKAAAQGHTEAQYRTAYYYYKGRGCTKNFNKAKYWYELCLPALKARNDSWVGEAEQALRDIEREEKYGPRTPAPKPAPAKTVGELFDEAMRYYDAKEYAKALSLFEQIANMGLADAQYICGVMYYDGEGCTVNKPKALYWFEKAAQQDLPEAQFNCGIMYSQGEGCKVDVDKAIYWFEKAADQGIERAQKILSVLKR